MFGKVQATSDPFEMPSSLEVRVKILSGSVCDDEWGQEDAYVQVSVGGKTCFTTQTIRNNDNPTWNREGSCGSWSKSAWGSGKSVKLWVWDSDNNHDDSLGWGYSGNWKYGQRAAYSNSLSTPNGSDCKTKDTRITYELKFPVAPTHTFCLRKKGTETFSLTQSGGKGYYELESELNSLKAKGDEIAYKGQTVKINGEDAVLGANCNHKVIKYVTLCSRDAGSVGELATEKVDSELVAEVKTPGTDYFNAGERIVYNEGMGTVQANCEIHADAPSTYGDPHFKTWGGEVYDFHGGCALVLLKNPHFADGLGMAVHIRTQIHNWWSSINTVAIQIGDRFLEVRALNKGVLYHLDGEKEGHDLQTAKVALGDYLVNFFRINDHQGRARIDLGDGDAIAIETFKTFARVNIKDTTHTKFTGSAGLLGSYPYGTKQGRNGAVIEDANEFGQEWMVTTDEPTLFHDIDPTQPLPSTCLMPEANMAEGRRRLGEAAITEDDAAIACAHVNQADRDFCIFDVMATNDKDMAGSY